MSRSPDKMTVRIANASVEIPVYQDEKTTLAIVERVTGRIREIEETYNRVDSQAYALRAAYEFAIELDQAQRAAEHESRDIIVALDEVMTRLNDLLETYGIDLDKPTPSR